MPHAINSGDLAAFQCLLIGTWTNDPKLEREHKPLSFNVMPLPQVTSQPGRPAGPTYGGFILKNFTFTETIRFNGSIMKNDPPEHIDRQALAIVASAPNRGGSYTQAAHAVFYDQLVHFAEGPRKGHVIHVENGAWLHFGSEAQQVGPYGPNTFPGQILAQPPYITIAKQISVPHGNSVLALGSVDLNDRDKFKDDLTGNKVNTIFPGPPVIPDAFVPYPVPAETATQPYVDPYALVLTSPEFENPNPHWTLNPNFPLQKAIEIIKPKCHIHWRVTTEPLLGDRGSVTNVPFEERKSKVTAYWADYWLLSQDEKTFDYLAYTQTIIMEMEVLIEDINGDKVFRRFVFPHVTSNTVKKVKGTPEQARAATISPLE
jgi:hypothetical protein